MNKDEISCFTNIIFW